MKELFLYLKKNFEKPENGLIQIMIVHIAVMMLILFVKIGFLFTLGSENVDIFLARYFYLSSASEDIFYKPWTLFSYFFMPESFFSMVIGLVLFYFFGRVIVSFLGSRRLVIIYLAGGLVGGLTFLLVYSVTPLLQVNVPVKIHLLSAVYAVVVAAATFAPNYLFHRVILPVPIKYFALFLLFQVLVQLAQGRFMVVAQLGSALFGYLYMHYIRYMARNPHMRGRIRRFFTGGEHRFDGDRRSRDGGSEKDLQALFDKISAKGYHSLTKAEKDRLFHASKK